MEDMISYVYVIDQVDVIVFKVALKVALSHEVVCMITGIVNVMVFCMVFPSELSAPRSAWAWQCACYEVVAPRLGLDVVVPAKIVDAQISPLLKGKFCILVQSLCQSGIRHVSSRSRHGFSTRDFFPLQIRSCQLRVSSAMSNCE